MKNLAEQKKEFFKRAYGLFIHYGVYSIYGRGEWMFFHERRTNEDYFQVLPQYQPKKEYARQWVELAKRGGMKYAVLTTRHHEGVFIGDEILREFAEACRENGLGVGFYYSVADWSDPDYCAGPKHPESWERFVQKTHRQVKEIMADYGKVDYLFYDGCPPPETWRLQELHKEIRAMQPDMLISRCIDDTDLISCEQHSGGGVGLWESCYTLNNSWAFNQFDGEWKSPKKVAEMLSTNRHNGGNFLLNVGPRADGSVQQEAIDVIEKVGDWVKANEEALYDIEPHPFNYLDQEISTGNGENAYIRLTREYGPERRICGIGNKIKRISILSTGEELKFDQKEDVITVQIPKDQNGELWRFLKLELEGKPFGIGNPKRPDCNIKTTGE